MEDGRTRSGNLDSARGNQRRYFEDCNEAEPLRADSPHGGVAAYALDPGQAARLWQLSTESLAGRGGAARSGGLRPEPRDRFLEFTVEADNGGELSDPSAPAMDIRTSHGRGAGGRRPVPDPVPVKTLQSDARISVLSRWWSRTKREEDASAQVATLAGHPYVSPASGRYLAAKVAFGGTLLIGG